MLLCEFHAIQAFWKKCSVFAEFWKKKSCPETHSFEWRPIYFYTQPIHQIGSRDLYTLLTDILLF